MLLHDYVDRIVVTLENSVRTLSDGAPIPIVGNDRRDLDPAIQERARLSLVELYPRHVNRRTGRRAGEFFEDVLIARPAA